MKRLLFPLLSILLSGTLAHAAGNGVSIELNKLEPREGACRAYLVIRNCTSSAFETLKLDLVMFDADGIVAKRVAVETAPLPAGKTNLKVFDIDALPCDRLGRPLLNNVMTCADASGAKDARQQIETQDKFGSGGGI